jgi:pimeloyl-ACP methyl ester carboxylesterase
MANTFVMVHGAWHAAWCWAAVIRQLEAGGDRAFAVDLPGRGSNPCDHARVTRAMWVESVARFIEERDLKDVVLAGHSLGGLTISGVAQQIPQRLKRVVYVSALVPRDGLSVIEDMSTAVNLERASQISSAAGAASTVVQPDGFRRYFMQDGSGDLQDFVLAALIPEVAGPSLEKVPMKDCGVPSGYIVCEDDIVFGDPALWHPHLSSRLRNPVIRSVKSGHEVMFTRPVECARALAEIAAA